jgi:hypothetical protein
MARPACDAGHSRCGIVGWRPGTTDCRRLRSLTSGDPARLFEMPTFNLRNKFITFCKPKPLTLHSQMKISSRNFDRLARFLPTLHRLQEAILDFGNLRPPIGRNQNRILLRPTVLSPTMRALDWFLTIPEQIEAVSRNLYSSRKMLTGFRTLDKDYGHYLSLQLDRRLNSPWTAKRRAAHSCQI